MTPCTFFPTHRHAFNFLLRPPGLSASRTGHICNKGLFARLIETKYVRQCILVHMSYTCLAICTLQVNISRNISPLHCSVSPWPFLQTTPTHFYFLFPFCMPEDFNFSYACVFQPVDRTKKRIFKEV